MRWLRRLFRRPEPDWLQGARERDASYPEHLPEHWTAIIDRRRLLTERKA